MHPTNALASYWQLIVPCEVENWLFPAWETSSFPCLIQGDDDNVQSPLRFGTRLFERPPLSIPSTPRTAFCWGGLSFVSHWWKGHSWQAQERGPCWWLPLYIGTPSPEMPALHRFCASCKNRVVQASLKIKSRLLRQMDFNCGFRLLIMFLCGWGMKWFGDL